MSRRLVYRVGRGSVPGGAAGPVVSNIAAVLINPTAVSVSWDLDVPGTGIVDLGLTTGYGITSTPELSLSYTRHVQVVSGLAPATTYHFRPRSTAASGIETAGSDGTFATITASPRPATMSGLIVAAVPAVALPGYLSPITDPAWGTVVTRVSNVHGRRHDYPRHAAWNSDGSLLALLYTGAGLYPGQVIDGNTYAVIRTISHPVDALWSNVDPSFMWGMAMPNQLVRRSATDTSLGVWHTFTGYTNVRIGDGEGSQSDDDRYFALLGNLSGAEKILVHDAVANTTVVLATSARPNNCSMSRSGAYVVVVYNSTGSGTGRGSWVYDRDGTNGRQFATHNNHGDPGRNAAGQDVYVTTGSGLLTSYRLSDLAATNLLPGGAGAAPYCHISCRNIALDGWCLVSVYYDQPGQKGNDLTFGLALDGSGDVMPWAHQHAASDISGTPYDAQPHSVPNPDMTKVGFASDWGASNVYEYVAEAA